MGFSCGLSVLIIPPPWAKPLPAALVAGVDPGLKGGVSIVAETGRLQSCVEMPTYDKLFGKKVRQRLDIAALDDMLMVMQGIGVEMLVCEDVGAGYGTSGRQLGEQIGVLKALCYKLEFRFEMATPTKWKKAMLVPADKREACWRAEALFPHDRDMLLGPRGGRHDGKAESAMVALYGHHFILRTK